MVALILWTIVLSGIVSTLIIVAACIASARADRAIRKQSSVEHELEQLRELRRVELKNKHRDAEIEISPLLAA